MRGWLPFTKKELLEQWRGWKCFILWGVLLLFGMLGPLTAKFMPELIAGMGMEIVLPPPTYLDAYVQFFKNLTQMGLMVVLLVFATTVYQEFQRGTALLLFSRGLSRPAFLLGKYAGQVLVWTVGYALSAGVAYGYTAVLFPEQAPQQLFWALLCLWLLGDFILALLTLFGALGRQAYLPLLLTAGVLMVLLLLQTLPPVAEVSPLALGSRNLELIQGVLSPRALAGPMALALGGILACLGGGMAILRVKSL